MVTTAFKNWALGYSGCDGGDLGSPDSPATWICGIEWGGGHTADQLTKEMTGDVSVPPLGYGDPNHNLKFRFNYQAIKLLTAISGGDVHDYKNFTHTVKPFNQGTKGYFKANLYPIGFRNTNKALWKKGFASITGFDKKREYVEWCRNNRFPQMRTWVTKHQPKLIICLGKTYAHDFYQAFFDDEPTFNTEIIDDRTLQWSRNDNGTLLIVVPFMIGRWGLVRNESIQKFGERISNM